MPDIEHSISVTLIHPNSKITLKDNSANRMIDRVTAYVMQYLSTEGAPKIKIETAQPNAEFRIRKAIQGAVAQKLRENTPENPDEQ